ncbi:MAG TPA: 2-phosphosulfolactate phosphatase [Verrucomicrobiae bacterium]|nr:2-phosphosulfolactate phosphatase [Verrucomicrobiae bacterium]
MKIDTVLSPRELPSLAQADLRETVCVVFDVLRATSTFVTALQNGAREIIPVGEISEALEIKKQRSEVLLGGERNGLRISNEGIEFDFGNSPREYTAEKVAGKTIVSTTTNGTRALKACAGARGVLAASFLNLTATAQFMQAARFENVLLVCAGTRENASLEDILCAGALCELLLSKAGVKLSDPAQAAHAAFESLKYDLAAAVCNSENAQRLLAIPPLRGDVQFCLQYDLFPIVAKMNAGVISV